VTPEEKRDKHARLALIAYADKRGSNYPQPAATDLIADILHAIIGKPSEQNDVKATRTLHRALIAWRGDTAASQEAGSVPRPCM
jgi:hypothetical protein